MKKVYLKPGKERSVLRMHPWVFSGALEPPTEEIAPGEIVAVQASNGETVGCGWWSTMSQIRVRMVSFLPNHEVNEDYFGLLTMKAVSKRTLSGLLPLFGGPVACRLINAENDDLPGVVADYYAGWVVCQFTTAGAERHKDIIAQALMTALPGCNGVAERRDADARKREQLPCEEGIFPLAGETPPDELEITENGIRFAVDILKGHKTGFYLDQRDAREAVAAYANGKKDVLNCFSYSGGFGIYAAIAGAKKVTQVDSSADAIAMAQKNASLNAGKIKGEIEYETADVFKYLRLCRDKGRVFDMIVLDPPKFADGKSQLMKAARGYKDINLLAMKLLAPGGVLATFSCSGAVSSEFFDQLLAEAAADARRRFQILARTGQPKDHPVALSFPEGRYLKGVILQTM